MEENQVTPEEQNEYVPTEVDDQPVVEQAIVPTSDQGAAHEVEETEVDVIIPESAQVNSTVVSQVQAGQVSVMNSVVGQVQSEGSVKVSNSVGGAFVAGGNISMQEGGGFAFVAGGNMELENGGGMLVVNGGDMDITNGGAQFVVNGGNLQAQKTFIGMLISSGETHLSDDSRVLLNTPQAVAFGAAFGAVYALLRILLRKKR